MIAIIRAHLLPLVALSTFTALPLMAQQASAPGNQSSQPAGVTARHGALRVAQLFSAAKDHLVGAPVTLLRVQVRDKTNRDALWVGPSDSERVLVTMPATVRPVNERGGPAKIDEGDFIHVTGVVQRAPLPHMLHEGWGVDEDDLPLIERAGVIISATSIESIATE